MKVTACTLAVALFIAAAEAQNTTTGGNSSDYATGLVAALNGAGLTTLAGVLGNYPQFGQVLQMGGNYTVFAPNNDAFSDIASVDPTMIESILSYHISPAPFDRATLTNGTNHTIIPSLLQEPLLGNNQSAPLVLSYGVDGSPRVRTASQNVTVGANATYMNVNLQIVNEIIMPPMNLTATVAGANLTGLSTALGAVSALLPATALEMTERNTVFAPTNAAFQNISSTLTTLQPEQIATVLGNHVINGSVVYSTMIMPGNTTAISAAGETFSFMMEGSDLYVMSGNATRARIVRTDIPITNGVVHLI